MPQHIDTSKNSKAWAVSQHIDTSKNTKAWAVSQHIDTSKNTKAWTVSRHTDTSKNTKAWAVSQHIGIQLSTLKECMTTMIYHGDRMISGKDMLTGRVGPVALIMVQPK